MKYSIVIPCYNESKNLKKLVTVLKAFPSKYNVEFILVENGSTDDSKEVIKNLKLDNNKIRCVYVEKNQGYGYGILQGLKAAKGDYVGWIHADLQFAPIEFTKAFDYLKTNDYPKDVFIKGKRTKRPLIDKLFTMGMSVYETLILHKKLWDINGQPTLMSKKFFDEWENPPYDFSLDLYAYYLAKLKKLKIYRFKVEQHKREEGTSSWNNGLSARFKLIKRVTSYSKNLKKNLKKDTI